MGNVNTITLPIIVPPMSSCRTLCISVVPLEVTDLEGPV